MPIKRLMENLRGEITTMSEMVEKNVNDAIMALIERSGDMAREVIDYDRQVDEMELTIERRCVEILQLASHRRGGTSAPDGEAAADGEPGAAAPLTTDEIRFVYASLKISTDLERMSDLAGDVARQVQALIEKRSLQTGLDHFAEMLECTSTMVRDSVLSLLEKNVTLAWRVCTHDDLVDEVYQALEVDLYRIMETDGKKAVRAAHLMLCALDLERIADHATNIAEDVIYILEGKLVHHHIDEWRRKLAPELDKRRSTRMLKKKT